MKKLILSGLISVSFLILCGCGTTLPLRMVDIEPKLAGTNFGENYGFAKDSVFIEYTVIGVGKYDDFFKSSAKLNGLNLISAEMTKSTTAELKKYAMSKASDEAMAENIKELTGDTPPEEWSKEQQIAVLKMAKEKDKISSDEKSYFMTSSVSLGIVVYALGKGIVEAKDLLPKGKDMLSDMSAVPFHKKGGAAKGVKKSVANLKDVAQTAPGTLEELKVLLDAFKQLSAD